MCFVKFLPNFVLIVPTLVSVIILFKRTQQFSQRKKTRKRKLRRNRLIFYEPRFVPVLHIRLNSIFNTANAVFPIQHYKHRHSKQCGLHIFLIAVVCAFVICEAFSIYYRLCIIFCALFRLSTEFWCRIIVQCRTFYIKF